MQRVSMQRINVQRIGTMNSFHVRMLMTVMALFCSTALLAQNASFTGHVTDSTGAVVRGAQIVVHDQNTNVESSTATNSAGVYEVPYLNPDKYTLTVSSLYEGPPALSNTISSSSILPSCLIESAAFRSRLGASPR